MVSVMLRIEGRDGISKPKKSGKNGNMQYPKWETKAEERNKDFFRLCLYAMFTCKGVEVEEEAD